MDPSRLLRPGPIAAVVAVVVLWLIAPEIFTGSGSDAGTFALVLALAVGVAVWVWGVRRFVSPPPLRLTLIGVPLLVLAWVVLWPYLRPATRVDEAFPVVTTTVAATGAPLFNAADAEDAALGPIGLQAGRVAGSFAHIIAPWP